MLLQQYHRQRTTPRPAAAPSSLPTPTARPVAEAPPGRLVVSITAPAEAARPPSAPLYVDIRGPDGSVRTFPVEGGRAAIQPQTVIIRPGETMTVKLQVGGSAR
jgi:hypothetical protein